MELNKEYDNKFIIDDSSDNDSSDNDEEYDNSKLKPIIGTKKELEIFISSIEEFKKEHKMSINDLKEFMNETMKDDVDDLIDSFHISFDDIPDDNFDKVTIMIGLNNIGISIPKKIKEQEGSDSSESYNDEIQDGLNSIL